MYEIDMKLAMCESEIASLGNKMIENKETYKWHFSWVSNKINDWIKILQGKNLPELKLSWGRTSFENSIFDNPDHESIIRGIVDSIDSAKKNEDLSDFDLTNARNSIPRLSLMSMESNQASHIWETTKCTRFIRSELCKRFNFCECTIHILNEIYKERTMFKN